MYYDFGTLRDEAMAFPETDREPDTWPNDYVACIYPLGEWLSANERQVLGDIASTAHWIDGQISDGDRHKRQSRSAWLGYSDRTAWLYRKIVDAFLATNACFHYDVRGLNEEPQLLHYSQGGHLDWHLDLGPGGASVRKLAIVALLDRTLDCQGGSLQFSGRDEDCLPTPGDAVVFPAFVAHRLTRLLSGSRLALVAWACGPAFR